MKLPWATSRDPVLDEPLLSAVSAAHLVSDDEWERQPAATAPRSDIAWGAKPPDLVRLATHSDSAPSLAVSSSSLEWTREPPAQAGLWWWRVGDVVDVDLVVSFGGRLCTLQRGIYRAAERLKREWAGPISVPPGLDLERWWSRS